MKTILKAGLTLFIFTLIGVSLVALTQSFTRENIQKNEAQVLISRLGELLKNYDNDILQDKIQRRVKLHGKMQNLVIYPAKRHNKTFAILIEHTYPKGYSGDIRLLSGINLDGTLLGVRVISHNETPGLGDKIDTRKSSWIEQFKGLSLKNNTSFWRVKPDGGEFDAFTGATITPRAVVSATYEVLRYFKNNWQNEQ
jgi:electron transport complex protein RnfG